MPESSKRKNFLVGIDFGAATSAMAMIADGSPVMLSSVEGENHIPSTVARLPSGKWLAGSPARRQAAVNPAGTILSVKQDLRKNWQEAGMFFRKMAADIVESQGEKPAGVVIAVPAFFDYIERHAVKAAAQLAGLNAWRIIDDVNAVCLVYSCSQTDDEARTVMAVDIGEGGMSVCITETGGGVCEVKAKCGTELAGGAVLDEQIINRMAEEFRSNTGIELRENPAAMIRFKEAMNQAKRELSLVTCTEINLPFIAEAGSRQVHLERQLDRAEFDQIIDEALDTIMEPVRRALRYAQLQPQNIDRVILNGGLCRIPRIGEAFRQYMGLEPFKRLNSDNTVAMGAAIQAGILNGNMSDNVFMDVSDYALGIETKGGEFTAVIQRNSSIPTRKSIIVSTSVDNQPYINVLVLQGESRHADKNTALGIFPFRLNGAASRGVPQIEVIFELDVNGQLTVTARELLTGHKQSISPGFPLDQGNECFNESYYPPLFVYPNWTL